MTFRLLAALLACGCASASNATTVVGLLGGHKSTAWASSSACLQADNNTALLLCNLKVYDAAGKPKVGPMIQHDIAGPLCFAGDIVRSGITLPKVEVGEEGAGFGVVGCDP